MEFFHRHGLQGDFKVERGDADDGRFLVGPDPCLFDDFDVGNAAAGDDDVGIGIGDVIAAVGSAVTDTISGFRTYPTIAATWLSNDRMRRDRFGELLY